MSCARCTLKTVSFFFLRSALWGLGAPILEEPCRLFCFRAEPHVDTDAIWMKLTTRDDSLGRHGHGFLRGAVS